MPRILKKPSQKKQRLETRLTPEQRAAIERAAFIEGQSVSDFVTAAAMKAARRSIEHHEKMKLSAKDAASFARALLDQPEPNAALKSTADAHRKWITPAE